MRIGVGRDAEEEKLELMGVLAFLLPLPKI